MKQLGRVKTVLASANSICVMHNERRMREERSNDFGRREGSETIIARRLIEVGQSVARTKEEEEGENAIGSKRSPDRSMIA